MIGTSKIFFPLCTSVELFRDPNNPEAITRVKQAAVLYDEVIFEGGLYDVSITPEGKTDGITPAGWLTSELLQNSRRIPEPGTRFTLAIGLEGGDTMMPVFDASLSVAYAAEFHTGIINDLKEFRPDWVRIIELRNRFPASQSIGKAIQDLNRRDRLDEGLIPELKGKDPFLRDYIFESFNRDSIVAASLGASFSLTSLFKPMLKRRSLRYDWSGAESLRLFVRNLGALPWEVVVEFREHSGSQEARAKLREFEERAAQEEPQDAYDFLVRVSQEITNDLLAAWEDLRPNLPEELVREAAATGVSLIPVVGPFLGPGTAVGQAIHEALEDRRSWLAALMVLRRP